jgi:hypothetical protein
MTNARCLTEGVDIPAIDCVMFADPKQSRVDIIQAAGRALRRYRGKEYGYIVVPLVVPEKMDFKKFAETTAFKQVAQTITALSTQDERIADEFRAIEQGHVSSGRIVEIEGDIPAGMKMKLGEFAEAISIRVWKSVGRANWRTFEDACAFVHSLGLKSRAEWKGYSKSGKRPKDIPDNPNRTYANDGWKGWGNWIGTGRHHVIGWREFKDARAFTRQLGLKSAIEWNRYCKSGKKPDDIPVYPDRTYAHKGWAGMDDWLDAATEPATFDRQYRSFINARAFVRRLGLKLQPEWREYCKSGRKPKSIPADPNKVYAGKGWVGISDWLGTGKVPHGHYRPFKMARDFVRGLKLASGTEWRDYCRSSKKPDDIPIAPQNVYADKGWFGMDDWLGTGKGPHGHHRPFKKARDFVRGLKLRSVSEWRVYCTSGKKPNDIPVNPWRTYAEDGWNGWIDWLGTNKVAAGQHRLFKEARDFVRRLGLKSETEWRDYCKSGNKPAAIPVAPNYVYRNRGWAGMADWLGYAH